MELDKFLIGILVFTAIIVGSILVIENINDNYGDFDVNMSTDDFGDVYDTADEIYNISQDMKGAVLGGEVDEDSTEDSMFKGGYAAIRFLRESFTLVGDVLNAVALKLGIPSFFITLAMAALAIAVVFALR